MATQRPAVSASFGAFAGQLLAEREVAQRAQVIAAEAAARLGTAVVVYLFNADADPRWARKASVGEVKAPERCEALTLAMLAEQHQPLLFSGAELVREHYAHLDVRRTIASLAYVPLMSGENLLGAIEAVSSDRVLSRTDLAELGELVELSSRAIAAALSYESERNGNLETITRLAAFYDVEKVFHSTLQMGQLLPIVCSKTRELLPADAVNLWMVEDDALVLMARDGEDPSVAIGAPQDEVVAWVAEKGRVLTIRDRTNPILTERNRGGTIRCIAAVPIIDSGALVGVLECVNKGDGTAFNEDDAFLLTTVAETAAGALHNASLLEAERKVEILETLVEVSNEITSTLNLERVLQVVVNGPQRIMRYDHAAIALDVRGKLQLKAISGKTSFEETDPQIKRLKGMLEWAAIATEPVYVTVHDGKVVADDEDARAQFQTYFKDSGMRGWYSTVLADEQGRLGVLAFESKVPDFLSEAHLEFIKVVTSQASVAIRNASLYEEVPFIGLLQPLVQRKQQFLRMHKRRRVATVALAVAAVLFLVLVPLPMRVDGTATVAPQRTAMIQAGVDGTIRTVHVREGDAVKAGTILAEMDDWQFRSALASAQAKLNMATAEMNRALAANDGSTAGVKRVEAEYWASEVQRAQERLEHTRLRTPIDGLVATAHVEDLVGKKLDEGDPFAQVVDSSRASVDVAIDQEDVPLLQGGDATSLKLESFPTRKFYGTVAVVSPASAAAADQRVFYARVDVPNADGTIRAGMQGRGKVSVGWHPAGYVLFRGVGMWVWTKFWNWFGW